MDKRIFLLLGALLITPSTWASYYYAWTYNGSCYEYGSNGAPVQLVDNYRCERSVGYSYRWTYNGSCYEYGANGAPVQLVDNYRCERSAGYSYRWTYNGSCYEYGSNGAPVALVDNYRCENARDGERHYRHAIRRRPRRVHHKETVPSFSPDSYRPGVHLPPSY